MRSAVLILLAVMVTAVLLVLSLPLGEQGYLVWFALVPLLVATRDKGFVVGFVAGIASIILCAWISVTGALYAHNTAGGTSDWVYTGFGLFGFSFSIMFGFAAERGSWKRPIWWFAAVAVLLESVLLLQLPAHLALSQYRNLGVVQIASIGGMWLVSYLIWLANFGIARMRPVGMAATSVGLVILSFVVKGWALPAPPTSRLYAAVQVPDASETQEIELHRQASERKPDLVVWPEFGGLGLIQNNDTRPLQKISAGTAPFVTTFNDTFRPLPHNVAGLFADGKELGRYAKRKPFGGERTMHAAGDKAVSIGRVGLNICFDSCYPSIIRDTARPAEVDVIALPTIDPRATNNFIAAMHAAFTPFRAAESGVAIVRADGYAWSQVVDSRGAIIAEALPGTQVLYGEVRYGRRWTLSRMAGDWVLYVCGLLAAVGLLAPRHRRGQGTPHEVRVH